MADLSDSSFTAVNDIETAQGAPVSEALAQKYGSNENYLKAQKDLNDTDIATNAAAIAAIKVPNVQKSSSCGSFSNTSAAGEVQITNFSVAITASRTGVVMIDFECADSAGSWSGFNGTGTAVIKIKKDGTPVNTFYLIGDGSTTRSSSLMPSFIDTSAGTSAVTYTVTMDTQGISQTCGLEHMVMVCRELF